MSVAERIFRSGRKGEQMSLKLTGTPCRGPRILPVNANSSSNACASARACEKKTDHTLLSTACQYWSQDNLYEPSVRQFVVS